MRNPPYAGSNDTNDFDDLGPNEAAKMLQSYRLLGDCFELSDDEDLFGWGWLIEGWRDLLVGRQEQLQRAEREMAAAVGLAHHEGGSWDDIAQVLRLRPAEVYVRVGRPTQGQD
ncbi:hypothetical protein [Arthrobacter sp. TMS2-4]